MYMVVSWAFEVTEILTQRSSEEDKGDLTRPSRNQLPDLHITVSVVYDTF